MVLSFNTDTTSILSLLYAKELNSYKWCKVFKTVDQARLGASITLAECFPSIKWGTSSPADREHRSNHDTYFPTNSHWLGVLSPETFFPTTPWLDCLISIQDEDNDYSDTENEEYENLNYDNIEEEYEDTDFVDEEEYEDTDFVDEEEEYEDTDFVDEEEYADTDFVDIEDDDLEDEKYEDTNEEYDPETIAEIEEHLTDTDEDIITSKTYESNTKLIELGRMMYDTTWFPLKELKLTPPFTTIKSTPTPSTDLKPKPIYVNLNASLTTDKKLETPIKTNLKETTTSDTLVSKSKTVIGYIKSKEGMCSLAEVRKLYSEKEIKTAVAKGVILSKGMLLL